MEVRVERREALGGWSCPKTCFYTVFTRALAVTSEPCQRHLCAPQSVHPSARLTSGASYLTQHTESGGGGSKAEVSGGKFPLSRNSSGPSTTSQARGVAAKGCNRGETEGIKGEGASPRFASQKRVRLIRVGEQICLYTAKIPIKPRSHRRCQTTPFNQRGYTHSTWSLTSSKVQQTPRNPLHLQPAAVYETIPAAPTKASNLTRPSINGDKPSPVVAQGPTRVTCLGR